MKIIAVGMMILMSFFMASMAHAQKRVALVIGNSTYVNIPELPNPKNDAELMAATLKDVGFDVVSAIDVDYRDMRRAVKKFGQRLRASGKDTVGLFYYAGHGVQAKGANFLIPLGAEIESQSDLNLEAMNAANILDQMESAGNALNLVILDACRNNPYKGTVRSAGRGLARLNAASGSLIAFAAAPGQVAADGTGLNSPYTEALVKAIRQPGLTVEQVFKRTRVAVEELTSKQQTPWEESSLKGDFYFIPAAFAPDAASTQTSPNQTLAPTSIISEAERAWDRVKTTKNIRILEAYALQFKGSFYATLASERIKELAATFETRVNPSEIITPQRAVPTLPPAPPVSVSPSYNCDNRLNPAEKAICVTPKLASLDIQLAQRYLVLKGRMSRSRGMRLKRGQREWLRLRDRCGSSVGCIENAYFRRLDELNAF